MSRRGRGGLRALWCAVLIESIASAGCGGEATVTSADMASSGGEAPRPRRRRRRRPRAEDTSATAATTAAVGASNDGAAATGAAPTATVASNNGQTAAATGGTYEMGSPVVGGSGGAAGVRVEWIEAEGAVQCGAGETRALTRCPQCPREPENAGIVRAFVAVERNVIRCNPPTRADGKLSVRVQFSNDGSAMYVRFPGVRMDRDTGVCVGRALCAARVPNFQNPIATVPYDIHVLVPES
ncbi:MAG: hypothetical protein JNK05_12730 [Myxococcales bacterium]|nr:hypothetical protein [Myxococcales bacterium]